MDLDGVRTFVTAAACGQLQAAADELDVTQQAVSRRVASLEKDLGVRLFTRTARGVELTADGQAFLPPARELLRAAEQARAAVRPGGRPLRVDVVSRRIGPAAVLRDFHAACPGVPLEVVTLFDVASAVAAIRSGAVDASFRAVPRRGLVAATVLAARAFDEPQVALAGPAHPLAAEGAVTLARLAGYRIWIPGIAPGTEWAEYYDGLAREFGLTIVASGPDFGSETMVDVLARSADVLTLIGERTQQLWPDGHDLRRVPVRDPVPAYPHSLLWREGNPHPGLAALRAYLDGRPSAGSAGAAGARWVPGWAMASA
ncbi:MAG TPA: LysR family transcriptional regulator [Trebonia sp.]|jgi:DNA-binding transcriptional LysR family regulator|nr:LysR family transcriptional regulator [Trebonia sp.]